MNGLQKAGGLAALIAALSFLIAMVLLLAVIAPAGYGGLEGDLSQNAAFLAQNAAVMYSWNLVAYVIFGVALVVLALALFARLKTGSPALAQVATAFGLIWAGLMFASGMVANIGAEVIASMYAIDPAAAGQAWLARHFVVDGLGGGNEIVGGLWTLLISWAALRTGALPKALNILGLVAGLAGLVTVIPALGEVGAIFGLGSIVWFAWLGAALLRRGPSAAVVQSETFSKRPSAAD